MVSRIGDSLLCKTVGSPRLETENDTFRFGIMLRWYTTCSGSTKTDFLRNVLDASGDPLFLFLAKRTFDGAYTADIVYGDGE